MKRLVDLLRINEVRFTAIVLSVMTIGAVISLRGNLMSGGAVPCMYDIYLVGVMHVVSTFCVPFALFYILFVERYNQRPMQVIREGRVINVWKRSVVDLFILTVFFTLYVFVLTTIAGLVLTDRFYNWNELNSRCMAWSGRICEEQPSFVLLLISYIVETFETFLAAGIIMLGVWWGTNKEWAGYLASIVLITVDKAGVCDGIIFSKYYIAGATYKKGLSISNNVIYPLLAAIIVFALVNVLVRFKKKEFLGS